MDPSSIDPRFECKFIPIQLLQQILNCESWFLYENIRRNTEMFVSARAIGIVIARLSQSTSETLDRLPSIGTKSRGVRFV